MSRRDLEIWLGLMHDVALRRVPLVLKSTADYTRATASTVAMRSGRRFAQFTVMEGNDKLFGVIRPGWDVVGGQRAHRVGAAGR